MDKYTWDLSKMYKTNEDWYQDLEVLKREVLEFSKIDKNILKNGKTLKICLDKYYDLERRIIHLYKFAKQNNDADGLNNEFVKMVGLAETLYEDFETKTSYISIELKKLNNTKLSELYSECPELKTYDYGFRRTIKNKKHVLSLKEEELLAKSSNIRESFENIFSKLDAIDVLFDNIFGEELNHSNYSVYLKDKDAKKRKEAFTKYHEYYKNHANTISTCLTNSIKNDWFIASTRKYKSCLEMGVDRDNISPKAYKDLIKSVHKNLPLFQRYLKDKGLANNLSEQHMYDVYLMSANYDKKFTFDEARDIAIASVAPLGSEYQSIYKSAFTDRWMDAFYRKGKYSGAYSSGSYDSYPYLLLNYNESFRSIETLAHEMGHSMHSYYSHHNNPYHTGHYPIFLAEIASNVGELLLFDYMLKNSNDHEEKKYILEVILDSFKGSIFRQTQFAEYENILHEKIEKGESLSTDDIINTYYDLNKVYYGDAVISDDLIKYESIRIPHFYSAYYVYKYATGLALAYVFAGRIINKKKDAVENYLKFLKTGGTNYPLNVLSNCGVDFSSKTIEEAMKTFEHYVKEYEKLIKGVK